MTEVSVRELKSKLAEYLRRAEAGEEIAVTRRGKRVATLLPNCATPTNRLKTLEEKLSDLQARGIVSWNGKKFVPPTKRTRLIGEGPTISEIVIRDRR